MADVEGFLTRKIGPLPVWAYAAGGGVILSLVLLYRRGATASAGQPAAPGAQGAPGTGPFAPSPIVVTTGAMPPSTSSVNAPAQPASPSPLAWQFGNTPSSPQTWVWRPTTSGIAQFRQRTGQDFTSGIQPGTVDPNQFGFGQFGWEWAPLPAGSSFQQYVSAGGMGGAGSAVRMTHGGGQVTRFMSPHALPQYVATGLGGGGGHLGGLRAVAARTRLPLVRLAALNPGHWRPGSGMSDQVVYIH